MLEITCPFCGPRNEIEFVHGGPEKERRPELASETDDQLWIEYLTVTSNPVGRVAERWWHVRGCGCWFTVYRDTQTHNILQEATE